MVGHKDFDKGADNLVWVGPSQLTDLGGNQYKTPDKYEPGTLLVMNRGLPLARENDDGYIEIDDETFEMKEALSNPDAWLMVGYLKKP